MPPTSFPLRGALCSLAAFVLFSLNDITIKFLGGSYSPVEILFFAGIATFPMVVMQLMVDPVGGSLRPVMPVWTVVRMVIAVVNGLVVSYAFVHLPLSQSYAIFFTAPLLISVLAVPLLGEPIDLPRGAAVVMGLVGVLIVVRPGYMPLQLAHLAALAGAVMGALYAIILRKTGGVERMAVTMLYPMVAQLVVMAALLPLVYQPMPMQHLGLTWLMALEGFAGSLLIIAAYRYAPAVVVAPMQYVQIICATLFGVLYFGERMDTFTIIGIATIIGSGLFIMPRSGRPDLAKGQASPAAPS